MAWTHILRMQYVTVKSLLDQSDFDWDENTDIIMAKDDTWDPLLLFLHGHLGIAAFDHVLPPFTLSFT